MTSILVTGASGFIGSHFLNAIRDDFLIYAIARKSQKESGVPHHPNIIWILGDITNPVTVRRITDKIAMKGGVDSKCYGKEKIEPEFVHILVEEPYAVRGLETQGGC